MGLLVCQARYPPTKHSTCIGFFSEKEHCLPGPPLQVPCLLGTLKPVDFRLGGTGRFVPCPNAWPKAQKHGGRVSRPPRSCSTPGTRRPAWWTSPVHRWGSSQRTGGPPRPAPPNPPVPFHSCQGVGSSSPARSFPKVSG